MCMDNNYIGWFKAKRATSQVSLWVQCSVMEVDGVRGQAGWPLEKCLQLCPQAVVRLPLAQTDLWVLCGTFPHPYLQDVTPIQVKDPTRYCCRQEIELHSMHEACEERKMDQPVLLLVHSDRWMMLFFLTRAQLKAFYRVKGCYFSCWLSLRWSVICVAGSAFNIGT